MAPRQGPPNRFPCCWLLLPPQIPNSGCGVGVLGKRASTSLKHLCKRTKVETEWKTNPSLCGLVHFHDKSQQVSKQHLLIKQCWCFSPVLQISSSWECMRRYAWYAAQLQSIPPIRLWSTAQKAVSKMLSHGLGHSDNQTGEWGEVQKNSPSLVTQEKP